MSASAAGIQKTRVFDKVSRPLAAEFAWTEALSNSAAAWMSPEVLEAKVGKSCCLILYPKPFGLLNRSLLYDCVAAMALCYRVVVNAKCMQLDMRKTRGIVTSYCDRLGQRFEIRV